MSWTLAGSSSSIFCSELETQLSIRFTSLWHGDQPQTFKIKCRNERSVTLLCQGGVELSHVVQRGFDSQQLLEDDQRKRQVDDVLVVESQTTQHAEQEVCLQLLFGLSNRVEERRGSWLKLILIDPISLICV